MTNFTQNEQKKRQAITCDLTRELFENMENIRKFAYSDYTEDVENNEDFELFIARERLRYTFNAEKAGVYSSLCVTDDKEARFACILNQMNNLIEDKDKDFFEVVQILVTEATETAKQAAGREYETELQSYKATETYNLFKILKTGLARLKNSFTENAFEKLNKNLIDCYEEINLEFRM